MELTINIWVFLILLYWPWDSETRKYEAILKVPNGGRWGIWGKIIFCPNGHVNGFALKMQPSHTTWADDTGGLNGVRLRCTDGTIIETKSGRWGNWTEFQECPTGNFVSFALNMVEDKGLHDDMAAKNIQFRCKEGSVLTGLSHYVQNFGPWSKHCRVGSICGIQGKTEEVQGQGDDATLRDMKFFCCV
ncbi:vitelline membrane outer layer protein 1-like [Pseudonaja textilis]|uniref:vitelline membrane outer layer protein 1-like n=1 Tax=Pseudonaja textilis TaxID=8673 RepID=UPI000EAABC65|nr:vitelline membrane outer layer protein 1-like [Pseudonaja textilis]